MPSDLECVHLRERFKALHCAEIVANWSSTSRERSQIAQRLHHDADTLREMLRETNEHINTLAPISRLPPEILGTVFTMVAQAEPPKLAAGIKPGTLGWIRISHVRRVWRELCIGMPSLWGRAIGRLPEALPDFVKRAGNHVPLDFYLSSGWDRRLHGRRYTQYIAVDILRRESKRVESLEMRNGSFSEALSAQETLATYAFDVLQYLHIESAALPRINGVIAPLRASALQTVHFQAFFMPFIAPCLTTLSLHAINNRLDTLALYTLIQDCPLLEVIWLSNIGHLAFTEWSGLPVLQLPRLKRLHLELDIPGRDIDMFINSLLISTTAQLIVHRAKMVVLGDFLLFATVFRVTAIAEEKIAIAFIGNTFSLEAINSTARSRRLKAEVMVSNLTELSHTLHHLHLDLQPHLKRVTHLKMCSAPFCTAGTWDSILHLFNEVETLEITADSPPHAICTTPARTILEALGQCFDEVGMPLPSLPLPKLAHVKIALRVSAALARVLDQDLFSCLQTRAFAEARRVQTLDIRGAQGAIGVRYIKLVDRLRWNQY